MATPAEIAKYNKGPITTPATQPAAPTGGDAGVGLRPLVRKPEPYTPAPKPQPSTAGLRWAKGLPARVAKTMGMNLSPEERTETLVRSLNPVRTVPNMINQMVDNAPQGVKDAMVQGQGLETMGFPETSIREASRTQQVTNEDYGGVIPNMLPNISRAVDQNAQIREDAAAGNLATQDQGVNLALDPRGQDIGDIAAGGARRVFTDQANAGDFAGATVVNFDEGTGQNTYTDAAGNVVDPQFAPQEYTGGPSLRPFSPSENAGLTTVGDNFAIADGPENFMTSEMGFRGAASGGGAPTATGVPPTVGGGVPASGSGQVDQTMQDLRAGRANMEQEFAQTQQRVADLTGSYGQLQQAYQDAVRTGAPNASFLGDQLRQQEQALRQAETELDKQKTSLAFQPREGTYRQAAQRITDRQQSGALAPVNGITPRDEIEAAYLRDLPSGSSPEAVIQRRRILSAINAGRRFDDRLDINRINAEAAQKSADAAMSGPKRTEAQEAKDIATTNKMILDMKNDVGMDFSGFKPDPLDPTGKNKIGMGLIAGYPVDWDTSQALLPLVAQKAAELKAIPANKNLTNEVIRRRAAARVMENYFANQQQEQ